MEPLDPQAKALAKAIQTHESGGNYGARGASGENSASQYTPDTWKAYAKEVLGDENAPLTPDNDNKVIYTKVKNWKDQGRNPAQIASMWNAGEGRPNAYKENFRGVNSQGVEYDTPAYVQSVTSIYHQLKNQQPEFLQEPTQPQVQQERKQMIAGGQPVSVNSEKTEPTFGGQLARGLLRTPLKAALGVARGIGGLFNKDIREGGIGFQSDYLGTVVDPVSSVELAAQNLAEQAQRGEITPAGAVTRATLGQPLLETLDIGSLVPTGGAGKATAQAIAGKAGKGIVKQGLKQFGTGTALGTGMNLGQQLSSGEKIKGGELLASGLLGGGLNVAAGTGLPVLARGGKATGKAVNFGAALTTGKPNATARATAQRFIDKEVDRVAESLPFGYKQNQKNILSKTGSNGFSVWKELGLLPEQQGNELNTDKIRESLAPFIDKASQVTQKFAKNETALFDIDDSVNNVLKKIDKMDIGITQKEKIAKNITDFIDQNVTPDLEKEGKRFIDAEQLVKLKRMLYNSAGFDDTPVTSIKAKKILESPFYDLARDLSDNVDKNATLPGFKSANKAFSDYLDADRLAQQLSGRVARTSEGLVGKIARRGILSGGGAGIGGVPGAIVGNLVGEQMDRFYTDPAFRTSIFRKVLASDKPEAAIDDLARKLEENIQKRGLTKVEAKKEVVSMFEKYKRQAPLSDKEKINQAVKSGLLGGKKGKITID